MLTGFAANGLNCNVVPPLFLLNLLNVLDLLWSSDEAQRQILRMEAVVGLQAHIHTLTHTHTCLSHTTSVLTRPWRTASVTAVGTFIFPSKTWPFPMNRFLRLASIQLNPWHIFSDCCPSLTTKQHHTHEYKGKGLCQQQNMCLDMFSLSAYL